MLMRWGEEVCAWSDLVEWETQTSVCECLCEGTDKQGREYKHCFRWQSGIYMQCYLVTKFIQSELAHILTQKQSSNTSQDARRAKGNFLKGPMFKRLQKHTASVCAFIHGRTQTTLKLSCQSHCANTFKQISKRAFLTLSNSSIPPAIKANMMSQGQINPPPPFPY